MFNRFLKYEGFAVLIVIGILFADTDYIYAQRKIFFFKGYVKDIQAVSFVDNAESLTSLSLIHNRLNMFYSPSKKFGAALEIRNRLFFGEMLSENENFSKYIEQQEQLADMSVKIIDEKTVLLYSEIDRLWIGYSDKRWDIKAGRQRINWGINLVWNPNDIFNTYNFLDFDYEEMPGTDALRIQYYTGLFSNLDLAVKPSREKNHNIAALRFAFNKWNYDFQFLGGLYFKDFVIGTGWAGNISGAGFKGEVSYFKPRPDDTEESKEALSLSLSCDYSFNNGLYINGSFLFNSAANNDINDFMNLAGQTLTPKNLMPDKYSFLIYGNYGFTPIFSCNMSVIYSPVIQSLIVYPGLYYSLSNNWDLDLIAQSFLAKQNGDFKTLGNSIYLRLRFSF